MERLRYSQPSESVQCIPSKIPYQDEFASFQVKPEENSTDRQLENSEELLKMHINKVDLFPSMINATEKKTYKQKNGFYERYEGYVEERFNELMQVSSEKTANLTTSSKTHEQQNAEINALREEFYREVPGAIPKEEENEKEDRGYDIVFDVWGRNNIKEEDKEKYKAYLELQNRTYYGEESGVYDKEIIYRLGEKDVLYMDDLSSTTPFEEVVALGVAVAEKNNSIDLHEEKEELKGIIQMSEFAKFAGNGETYVMISESGRHPHTRYVKNFVDIGRKIVDPKTGVIYLKVTRFKSSHTSEEYVSISEREDSKYFNSFDFEASSVRGYHLSHFLFPHQAGNKISVHEFFDKLFIRHPDAINEKEYLREIYYECFPYVKAYIHLVCERASWKELARAHAALLGRFQTIMEDRKSGVVSLSRAFLDVDFSGNQWQNKVDMATSGMIAQSAKTAIISVGGACGSFRGYGDFGELIESLTTTALLNSFSLDTLVASGMEVLELIAKGCADCMKRGNPDNHYHCPDCNKKYPDQTHTKRTAVCGEDGTGGCGFLFDGCGAKQEEVPVVQSHIAKPQTPKIIAREDNVIRVNFGRSQEPIQEEVSEDIAEKPEEIVVYAKAS